MDFPIGVKFRISIGEKSTKLLLTNSLKVVISDLFPRKKFWAGGWDCIQSKGKVAANRFQKVRRFCQESAGFAKPKPL